MSALTQREYETLQLALDVLSADTARREKAALKRRDDAAIARLRATVDDVIAVRRKLAEIRATEDRRA